MFLLHFNNFFYIHAHVQPTASPRSVDIQSKYSQLNLGRQLHGLYSLNGLLDIFEFLRTMNTYYNGASTSKRNIRHAM